jgi:pyruvate formate lyase activating enzyme
VTNGYVELEALDAIGPYLDAYRVDIKGFDSYKTKETSDTEIKVSAELQDSRHCFYRDVANVKSVKPILEATIRAKSKWNMHVEIITNVVPDYNDDTEELHEIARWIVQNLGDMTPWHLSRFYPYLELSHVPPTPVSTLELARKIGIEEGLKFVYTGNVPGHKWENTYCYGCGKMLVERVGFYVKTFEIKNGICTKCESKIPIVGAFG